MWERKGQRENEPERAHAREGVCVYSCGRANMEEREIPHLLT